MSIGKTTKSSSDIHDLRMKIRMNEWSSQTTGMAPQNVQTNLAVLPEEYAFDFLLYCQRNPQAVSYTHLTLPTKA